MEAIRRGADAVYQATFQDGPWGGRADFLIRVDRPSALGGFSYEVVETKLARSAKARAILQLCFYSELLSKIQGIQPEWMHVVLGGGTKPEKFLVAHYTAYFRKVRRDFEEASRNPGQRIRSPWSSATFAPGFLSATNAAGMMTIYLWSRESPGSSGRNWCSREINTVARLGSLALPLVPKIDRIGEPRCIVFESKLEFKSGAKRGTARLRAFGAIEEGKGLAALPAVTGRYFPRFRSCSIRVRYWSGVSHRLRNAA